MDSPIRDITLDLYLYDLHDGLGDSETDLEESRRRFWQRIYNGRLTEDQLQTFKEREASVSDWIELLGKQRTEKFKKTDVTGLQLEGYYYPVKLGDTYALLLDSGTQRIQPNSVGQVSASAQPLQHEQLQALDQQLQSLRHIVHQRSGRDQNRGEIGEDWLVWGQLTQAFSAAEIQQIAETCYNALKWLPSPNWQRDFSGQGRLYGATWFELEHPDTTADDKNATQHLLIALFPPNCSPDQINQQIPKLHRHFLRLFHYRNKILWAHEQGVRLKRDLKLATSEIHDLTTQLQTSLSDPSLHLDRLQSLLAKALNVAQDYELNLSYFDEQRSTIAVNLANYQKRLALIQSTDPDCDLAFLTDFGNYVEEKFIGQIEADQAILQVSLKPLDRFIKTVEGIVGLERTKTERDFNRTLQVAGFGIGSATLVHSSLSSKSDELIKTIPAFAQNPSPWLIAGFPLVASLGVGIVFALLSLSLGSLFQRMKMGRR